MSRKTSKLMTSVNAAIAGTSPSALAGTAYATNVHATSLDCSPFCFAHVSPLRGVSFPLFTMVWVSSTSGWLRLTIGPAPFSFLFSCFHDHVRQASSSSCAKQPSGSGDPRRSERDVLKQKACQFLPRSLRRMRENNCPETQPLSTVQARGMRLLGWSLARSSLATVDGDTGGVFSLARMLYRSSENPRLRAGPTNCAGRPSRDVGATIRSCVLSWISWPGRPFGVRQSVHKQRSGRR